MLTDMSQHLNHHSEEADMLSKNMACRLIRTSVKEDVNVSSVFRYLATKCFQLMRQYNNMLPLETPVISECLSLFDRPLYGNTTSYNQSIFHGRAFIRCVQSNVHQVKRHDRPTIGRQNVKKESDAEEVSNRMIYGAIPNEHTNPHHTKHRESWRVFYILVFLLMYLYYMYYTPI